MPIVTKFDFLLRKLRVSDVDQNNKGGFVNEAAIVAAYPTGQAGWFLLNYDTDTFWIWDAETSAWVDSDRKRPANALVITAISNPATAIPAVSGVAYTYTLTGDESLTFGTPAAGLMLTLELHLIQPSTPVSFSFGTTVIWIDDTGNFASANDAPDLSIGDMMYALVFRYDGTDWLGNLAYTKEVV